MVLIGWAVGLLGHAQPLAVGQVRLRASPVVDLSVQIEIAGGQLVLTQVAQITVDRPARLDLDAAPLELPLLVAMNGEQLAPLGSVTLEVQGDLRAEPTASGLRVRGRVAVGGGALVRAKTSIPFESAQIEVGVRPPGPATTVTVVVSARTPARPSLRSLLPARSSQYTQGPDRLAGAIVARRLRSGETARFVIGDLPIAPQVPQQAWIAVVGAGGVLAVLGLWSLRRKQRGKSPQSHEISL